MRITIQHKQTIYQIQRTCTEHKVHLMFAVSIHNGGTSFGAKPQPQQAKPPKPPIVNVWLWDKCLALWWCHSSNNILIENLKWKLSFHLKPLMLRRSKSAEFPLFNLEAAGCQQSPGTLIRAVAHAGDELERSHIPPCPLGLDPHSSYLHIQLINNNLLHLFVCWFVGLLRFYFCKGIFEKSFRSLTVLMPLFHPLNWLII